MNDDLISRVGEYLQHLDLRKVSIQYGLSRSKDDPKKVEPSGLDLLTIEGKNFVIMARIRRPIRQRSQPEVTILPSPYAHDIEQKVKEGIVAALKDQRDERFE